MALHGEGFTTDRTRANGLASGKRYPVMHMSDAARTSVLAQHETYQRCVLKKAIDVYYDQVSKSQPKPAEILSQTGFIGCGEGSTDLAERYKEELRECLSGKHDHR